MIYRNSRLLSLAKFAPKCFACHVSNVGQVVACHSNQQGMGKGIGMKSADIPAYMCSACHDEYDGRVTTKMNKTERESMWDKAALLSLRWALENHPDVFR